MSDGRRRILRRGHSRGALLAALLVLAALLIAACAAPPDNAGPVQAVEAFVGALERRDASAIIALIEPSDWRGEIGPELRSYLGLVSAIDIRDARYTVTANDGDTAVVRLVGTLAYTIAENGRGGERPVDLSIETSRVDGAWYLRQLQLPQP